MGAARYIGRVGGLAVAMGVGTAILTGYGVASAEPGSAASSSTSSESTSNSSSPSRSTASGSPSRNASAASGVSGSTGAPESTQTSSDSSHRQEHTVRIGIGRRLDNPTSYEVGPARRGGEHRRRADQFRYVRQRRYRRWPPVHRHLGELRRDNTVNTADPRSQIDISSVV